MQKLHDRKNVGKVVLDPAMAPKPKPATPIKGKKGSSVDKEDKKKEEDTNGQPAEAKEEQGGEPRYFIISNVSVFSSIQDIDNRHYKIFFLV